MKKLSTHIKGLDELFLGGIQVTSVTGTAREANSRNAGNDNRDRDSLVIVVRGARGVNKHLFAMQLMHGLGKSIYEEPRYSHVKGRLDEADSEALRYYSINKPTHLLEDMYLDLLIERWISHTNIEYKDILLDNPGLALEEGREPERLAELNRRTGRILNFLFDVNDSHDGGDSGGKSLVDRDLAALLLDKDRYMEKSAGSGYGQEVISRLFAENIIGYNARTNSIHLRTAGNSDNDSNFLLRRRYETIRDFRVEPESSQSCGKGVRHFKFDDIRCNEGKYYNFRSEFLNVAFNRHLKKSKTGGKQGNGNDPGYIPVRNTSSARMNFFSILEDIEAGVMNAEKVCTVGGKDGNNRTSASGSGTSATAQCHDYHCEVVVIEGFSHISEKDLQSLPYTHFISMLRKLSRISILVFEDSQTTMPDGDIEIEIRSNYDVDEDYSYNELRIAKCVNQLASMGWHRYKRQESHMRIYPSLHLNLFKRSYVSNQMHEIGRSVLRDSYTMQMESRVRKCPHDSGCISMESIRNIIDKSCRDAESLLSILQRRSDEMHSVSPDDSEENSRILGNILCGKWQHEEMSHEAEVSMHCRRPITTIVGNLNSFKRNLALYGAFAKVRNEDAHVLVILLDKDPYELRNRMICPGISHDGGCVDPLMKQRACRHCYSRISFLNVNSGCIPPEEFISMVKDHISVYTGEFRDNINGTVFGKRRPLHIVLDDYHRIDFCYPFLSRSNLFTAALISLCQKMEVGLTILCDKDSKRVREVCTLSDYVMCVRREERDVPRKATLFIERNGDDCFTGNVIKYEIPDSMGLSTCDGESFRFMLANDVNGVRIGSMKEYWRQTYNIIEHSDRSMKF